MKTYVAALIGITLLAGNVLAQETLPPLKKGGSSGTSKSGAPNSGKAGAPAQTKSGSGSSKDHASYAIGLDLAARFRAEEADLNPDMIARGLKDGFAGSKLAFTEDQLRSAMETFQKDMEAKRAERLKVFAAENKTFLADNKKKPGVKTLKSGLQYQVLKSGSGPVAKLTDRIQANYHGTLIDGTVFESTTGEGGEPVEIDVQETIPGWTEALQLMKVGDKWRLFIPADLAYGEMGNPPVLPPHATLIFELELVSIVKAKEEAKSGRVIK